MQEGKSRLKEQNLMRERNTNICISNHQAKNTFIQIISVYEKTKKRD